MSGLDRNKEIRITMKLEKFSYKNNNKNYLINFNKQINLGQHCIDMMSFKFHFISNFNTLQI